MDFLGELKRRNVVRVAVAYVILGWLLLQVTDVVVPILELPDWVARLVLFLLLLGLPVALFLAWAFELTPEGIRRESDVNRSESITPRTGRKLDLMIIGIMAAGIGFLLLDRYLGNAEAPESRAEATPADVIIETPAKNTGSEKSVAVLPFVNMSDDAANEYFSDGISEELLNVLVRVDGLRVPSRTSSFTFKGTDKKLTEVGKELNVDHILEGSVRKSGDRIRVTAQLIDVHTDTHLWSQTYTRELDDIFAVQDEISQAIIGALKVTLTGEEQQNLTRRSTSNVEAYNKYLLGRHLWNQRSTSSLLAATEPLREAVAMDPQFDQAWAALGDVYALLPEYGGGTIEEIIPLGRDAVARALKINPNSARALTASAYIKAMYDYDFPGALADFDRALTIEPSYATAHQWYGEILAVLGRMDESRAQLRKARELDPLASVMPQVTCWLAMGNNELDRARQFCQQALALNPGMQNATGNLYFIELMAGNFEKAREWIIKQGQQLGFDPSPAFAIIDGMENPELKQQALDIIASSGTVVTDGPTDRAWYYMLFNEPELAMENLEKSFAAGDPYAIHVNRIVAFDPLRKLPRFRAHLARMNLPVPAADSSQ